MLRKLHLIVLLALVSGSCKAMASWWDIADLKKLCGKDFVTLYLASWVFQQRLVPYAFGVGVDTCKKYFNAKELALKKIEEELKAKNDRLSNERNNLLGKKWELIVELEFIKDKIVDESNKKKVAEKYIKLNDKLKKNKEEKRKLYAEAKEKLGEEAAKKFFNLKQAAPAA